MIDDSSLVLSSLSTIRASGWIVLCRNRRKLSRWPVPSVSTNSETGTPHAPSTSEVAVLCRLTSDAGGSAPDAAGLPVAGGGVASGARMHGADGFDHRHLARQVADIRLEIRDGRIVPVDRQR